MIADASVVIFYAKIGKLALLRDLFESIEIPSQVRDEIAGPAPAKEGALVVMAAMREGWLLVDNVRRADVKYGRMPLLNLGEGEKGCIALAIASRQDSVLLDDVSARSAAKLVGLRPIGSLGVLALAHRRGIIASKKEVASILSDLVAAGLLVGADVIEAFWQSVGGRP